MPRKEFEAFTRLDASDVNSFLMDQSVMTFGSATARDVAIDTPVEGQVTYLTDIDSLSVYNGTQWVTNRPVMSFAGTAARGSAIPSPVEGMTTYLEDTDDLQVWNGTRYASPFGLTLLKKQTIGTAVTTVTVSNAFSADYDSYKIMVNGGSASVNTSLGLKLGSTTTGYYFGGADVAYSSSAIAGAANNNTALWLFIGYHHSSTIVLNCELLNPFLTTPTILSGGRPSLLTAQGTLTGQGFLNDSLSYTDFTLVAGSGNLTGGTISVYGYRKS
jgi:hypothetical protein